jgi:hypothetical protein
VAGLGAAQPNEGCRRATSGSTRSGAAREEELRSGTPSAHREFSIDATCIHHLIVKEKWMDVRLKRDWMS